MVGMARGEGIMRQEDTDTIDSVGMSSPIFTFSLKQGGNKVLYKAREWEGLLVD